MTLSLLISSILGYLIGSINTSIVFSKMKKNDIREHGSGNAGATNTLRVLGKGAAALVLLGDGLKAVISILLAWWVAHLFGQDAAGVAYSKYFAALFTVLGHNFPVFFGFRGGKGIVTSIAVMYMLDWRVATIALLLGVLVIVFTRFVSLGSMTGCLMYPVFVFVFSRGDIALYEKRHLVLALILGALGIWRHRSNIKKLLSGTESKIGEKAKS